MHAFNEALTGQPRNGYVNTHREKCHETCMELFQRNC
jgi:hypothetical protein